MQNHAAVDEEEEDEDGDEEDGDEDGDSSEEESEEEEEMCGVCQQEFESACPGCKTPGDDCPLSRYHSARLPLPCSCL